MNQSLSRLLFFMSLTIGVGYFSYSLIHPTRTIALTKTPATSDSGEKRPHEESETYVPLKGISIDETGAIVEHDDSSSTDTDLDTWGTEDDDFNEQELTGEKDVNSYMPDDNDEAQEIELVKQDEGIELDPQEQQLTPLIDRARVNASKYKITRLTSQFQKEEKSTLPFSDEFSAQDWKQVETLRETLTKRVLEKLGPLTDESFLAFMEKPQNRLDLARLQLINLVGVQEISGIAQKAAGANMLAALGGDYNWLCGMLYSGPTHNIAEALKKISLIYSSHKKDFDNDNGTITKRIATAGALESAREGWSNDIFIERFNYYFASYCEEKLNGLFEELQYWDMRLVVGAKDTGSWGRVRSLTWQRDNVRLPVEAYTGAAYQVPYRLRNVAGDSIFSGEYLAPILKYTNNTIAWAHREMGGVCGALSHYGTYGAIANGLPAITMGEPGHCAYTVRVNGEWIRCNSIYWQHSLHKTLWGEHDWDFLILMQDLYSDFYRTLLADQLAALGDILISQGKQLSAFRAYESALITQPLNWPVWLRYTAYLKLKAPQNKEKWKEVNTRVVEGLGNRYHNATSVLLRKYVYPQLLPLVQDRRELFKIYADFFKQCNSMGNNRWDIAPLLTAQLKACNGLKDQRDYMKESLQTLMRKADYGGAVLSWGLDYVAQLPEGNDKEMISDEFTELIIKALSRTRTSKNVADATWNALGEAIYAATSNKDRKIFQAIGKLAFRKCKKNFPKNKFKFRGFPGTLVSTTGRIETASTINPDGSCCLHWAVLQKEGGSMPGKFEGDAGLIVELEQASTLNGVVCIFDTKVEDDNFPFVLDVSSDGQNWTEVGAGTCNQSAMFRLDLMKKKPEGRFLRLRRPGGFKFEPGIIGFYAYGKKNRS